MIKETIHKKKPTEYYLFSGEVTTNKPVALKARQEFIKNFTHSWNESDADTRFELIRYIAELSPEDGIDLVLSGMQDFTRKVKLETKKVIEILAKKITIQEDRIISPKTAVRSEIFAKRIYLEMTQTLALDELENYLSILLYIGGRGPFFAWKFFIRNMIPPNIFIDILNKLPEKLRLRFVSYYFTVEISEKRERAGLVKSILSGVKDYNEAALFLVNIIENTSDCPHANIALGGALIRDFIRQLQIIDKILNSNLKTKDDQEKILCLKIAGIIDKTAVLYRLLPLLDKSQTRNVRIECIKVIGKSYANKNSRIKNALLSLLDDKDQYIIIHLLDALIKLEVPDLVNIACGLINKQAGLRVKLYKCLCNMKTEQLVILLDKLPHALSTDAKKTISKILIKRNPERLEVLLEYHKNNPDNKIKQAAKKSYNKIRLIKKKEAERLCTTFIPDSYFASLRIKKIIHKQTNIKQLKKLQQLQACNHEIEIMLFDEFFTDLDISGFKIKHVDFTGSAFLNTDLSSVYFKEICLKDVRFENTSFSNAIFDNVIFDNCVFINVDAHSTQFISCSFTNTSFCNSSFEFAEMSAVYFTGATIIKCDFSKTELSFASFTGAQLYLSNFKNASLFQTDFSFCKGMLCDFSETNIMEVARVEHSNLNSSLTEWEKIKIPSEFYETRLLTSKWFNILILTNEMDLQRDLFLKYNKRRKECALDTFKQEQENLFKIIPLLIHLTQHLIPIKKKNNNTILFENINLKNMSSGIYGYVPTQKAVKLTKKYLNCDKLLLVPGKKNHIEAIFTIGSIGTIAHSSDSDIDYWVCINKSKMESDAIELLKLKLDAIEKWAKAKFSTEIHFFVVDALSIRKGQFGGSDFESSGSAQGMILKEEFYRTMILVEGKIPFWCVLPVWAADKYYKLLYSVANRFHKDYLDFGNISVIPSGEYFGASMWQLFKSLTSPYKSVMKMALLGKYIQEQKESGLLCNKLKKQWATGKCNFRSQDPYLVLFEEIIDFYSESNQKEIASLVRLCFFLKLGVRSMKDLDKSTFKLRKILIQQCIDNFAWEEAMLCELGYFNEWSFEKISHLSKMINNFMIETYRKLSNHLNESEDSKAMITDRDLTILGRKMFVHFVSQPNKVEKLPHLAKGINLFKQLYIYYRHNFENTPSWEVYRAYYKKENLQTNHRAILKGLNHIEEIAAWIIQNKLLNSGTIFHLLPNPSSVSAQDFNELIHAMNIFFIEDEGDTMPSIAFLEQYKAHRLFLIVNFTNHRKDLKIFEYLAVYITTWGEFFCQAYKSKKGLNSISEAIENISKDLNMSFENTHIGYHLPKMSRKRIKI